MGVGVNTRPRKQAELSESIQSENDHPLPTPHGSRRIALSSQYVGTADKSPGRWPKGPRHLPSEMGRRCPPWDLLLSIAGYENLWPGFYRDEGGNAVEVSLRQSCIKDALPGRLTEARTCSLAAPLAWAIVVLTRYPPILQTDCSIRRLSHPLFQIPISWNCPSDCYSRVDCFFAMQYVCIKSASPSIGLLALHTVTAVFQGGPHGVTLATMLARSDSSRSAETLLKGTAETVFAHLIALRILDLALH